MPIIRQLRTVASASAPPKRGALAVTAETVAAEEQTTVIKPVNVQTPEDERTLRVFDLLAAFLALNPTPSDQQIHALAGLAGLNPEYFESVIYRLVGVIQKEEEQTTGEDGLRNKIQDLLNEDPMDQQPIAPQAAPQAAPQVAPTETLEEDPAEEAQVTDEDVDEDVDETLEDPEAEDTGETEELQDDPDDAEGDSETLEDPEAESADSADEGDDEEVSGEELTADPEADDEEPEPPKKKKVVPPKPPADVVAPSKDGKVESSIQRRILASDPYGRAAENDGVVDEELLGHPDPLKDASENDGALDEELE